MSVLYKNEHTTNKFPSCTEKTVQTGRVLNERRWDWLQKWKNEMPKRESTEWGKGRRQYISYLHKFKSASAYTQTLRKQKLLCPYWLKLYCDTRQKLWILQISPTKLQQEKPKSSFSRKKATDFFIPRHYCVCLGLIWNPRTQALCP